MASFMQAKFIQSAEKLAQCPNFNLPEYALLGRSNVGKSSFINGIANNKKLAKTSNTPGKTRLINLLLQICRDTDMRKFQKKFKTAGKKTWKNIC